MKAILSIGVFMFIVSVTALSNGCDHEHKDEKKTDTNNRDSKKDDHKDHDHKGHDHKHEHKEGDGHAH